MRVVFVGRQRTPWRLPIWYILTFGIYRRVWLYKVNKELDGHAALGLSHRLNLFLLILPILGPTIVTYQTTKRLNTDLHSGADLKYGPTWALWLGTLLVPIVGPASHMAWSQDRLNHYWDYERDNPEHGIELDPGLEKDKRFVVEMQKAREASFAAGSRFDRKREARLARWKRVGGDWKVVQEERRQVRAAGGSTPLLPWLRPRRPEGRHLRVTCGRCDTGFTADMDPFAETPLLCPRCGLHEVLPSLRGDPLRDPEHAGFAALEVDCPKCKTHFHAMRDLYDKTVVQCHECGHKETLPAPKPAARALA